MSLALAAPTHDMLRDFFERHHSGLLNETRTDLAEGLFLNADPALKLSGQYSSRSGHFLNIKAGITNPGEWFGLHIVLSLPPLEDLNYIGFVMQIASDKPALMRACLRSGMETGGFHDSFFDKHIQSAHSIHTHLDALYLDSVPEMPISAPWHELIVFLPCEDIELNLMHFHVFAV